MEFETVYLGELRTQTTHSENLSKLLTDAPKDNHGQGEAFSPTDLIAVASASCALTLMGIEANRLGIDIKELRVVSSKKMASKPLRRIASLTLTFTSTNAFDETIREKLEKAARTCPVHESLHPEIEQEMIFKWGTL